jgi:hypothetical protein
MARKTHQQKPVKMLFTRDEAEAFVRFLNSILGEKYKVAYESYAVKFPRSFYDKLQVHPGSAEIVDARIVSPKANACKIVPKVIKVEAGSGIKLANDTEWKVLVTFLDVDSTGSADFIVTDHQTVEIPPGEIRDIDIKDDAPKTWSCNYVIHRDENGTWVHCSGSGGGPDMIVEEPGFP